MPTLFVQFIHPGGEHSPKPKNSNHIPWNDKKDHKRKFLINPGKYLENDSTIKEDKLIFWGEWEAQSDVIQHFDSENNGYPQYLCQPYYSIPQNTEGLQNTDPFVFGKQFYYVMCQQSNKNLRNLERGSVILFGSCLNQKFVLDTVFVVSNYYDLENIKSNKCLQQVRELVSSTYFDVTIDRLLSDDCSRTSQNNDDRPMSMSRRLYLGATYENPVKEMFSFFPCLPYKNNIADGFKRPVIQIDDVISDNNPQGIKYKHKNYPKNLESNQILWNKVKQQVENKNLNLGVYADLPTNRQNASH